MNSIEGCVNQGVGEPLDIAVWRAADLQVEQLQQTAEKHVAPIPSVEWTKGAFFDSLLEDGCQNLHKTGPTSVSDLGS